MGTEKRERFTEYHLLKMGFPRGAVVKNPPACQCRSHRRCRFSPWVRKMPWRRKWQFTPVLLPGKFHGQRKLGELQSLGTQRVRPD